MNALAELIGGPSSGIALSTKDPSRTSARYARLSNVDLVKADRSPILAEKILLCSSYLSTRARSRKVAFRAHLSAVYLSRRRDKMRSPVTYLCRSQSVRGSVHNSAGSKTKFAFRVTTRRVVRYFSFLTLDYHHHLTYYIKYYVKSLLPRTKTSSFQRISTFIKCTI